MLKALAVLRTIFLIFIAAYTIRALPWGWSRTIEEEYARCTATRAIALKAAWIAIGWILFDTVASWWLATRRPKLDIPIPRSPGEPPFAPPPRS